MQGKALVLAAGRGTRMNSSLAKVLHPLLGRPMVGWAVAACREAGLAATLVVNHQEELVRATFADEGVAFARQAQTRGTGDAVASGVAALPSRVPGDPGDAGRDGVLVVLPGDAPLLRGETLAALVALHTEEQALVTVLTAELPDAGAFGRIVRDPETGHPVGIVEAAECTPEQLALTEFNSGVYAFDLAWLRRVLPGLQPHPPKGEIYITDCVELAAREGRCRAVRGDAEELFGVNDRVGLAHARALLQQRLLERWSLAGVTFEHPASTVVEAEVILGRDVTVGPGCVLRGRTAVGEGSTLDAHCVLEDAHLDDGVVIKAHSVLEGCRVASGAVVGPFARLRPEADVRAGVKVGNFVEVKKSVLHEGAKVNHLSYIGDASVGAGANVGAGTITCNYDGFLKHRTEIGAGAFIGSNSALVAPVRIGEGAIVGAGAVVVRDVPDEAIAVARGEQRTKEDAAPRFRARRQAEKDRLRAEAGEETPS